jgi:effector-binding domain-containing protein
VVYHDESERGVRWSIDVCAPVAAPITPTAEIQFKDMPQERIVSLMHFGPYDGLGTAYEAIDRFVREKGLVPAGPPREFYFSEPDVPPEKTQTLIEQPIL